MEPWRTIPETRVSARWGQLARWSAPWGFPVVSLGWAYVWWYPVPTSGASVWSFPNILLFIIGGLSPLLAVVGLHAVGNLTGELMGFSPGMYPVVVGGTLTIAAGLVVAFGPGSLRGWNRPRPRNPALAGEIARSPL